MLRRQLQSQDARTREETIRKLGWSRQQRAIELITEALKDQDVSVRCSAVIALGELCPRVITPLVEALVDEHPTVQVMAGEALDKMSTQWERTDAAVAALPLLVAALTDTSFASRERIAHVLGRMGDARAVESLRVIVDEYERPEMRRAARKALAMMGLTVENIIETKRNTIGDEQASRAPEKSGDDADMLTMQEAQAILYHYRAVLEGMTRKGDHAMNARHLPSSKARI